MVVHEGQVLLVQLTYQTGWYLPGGGVDRGESFVQATRRELHEECAIEADDLELFGLYLNQNDRARDHVAVYLVKSFRGQVRAGDPREIAQARFFPIEKLPPDLRLGHRRCIEEYTEKRPRREMW
jgi:ADP-ribose pyrophosphatase YjhB (NUDIX family)